MKGTSRNELMKSCTRELVLCTNDTLNEGTGRNYFHFITHHEVPNNSIPTYGKHNHTTRPKKEETRRTRFAAGGNMVHYDGPVTLPTVE